MLLTLREGADVGRIQQTLQGLGQWSQRLTLGEGGATLATILPHAAR